MRSFQPATFNLRLQGYPAGHLYDTEAHTYRIVVGEAPVRVRRSDAYPGRLYVDPNEWHCGWGTRFVELGKTLSPQGLELHTHQENQAARALYEKHGFKAVKFGVSTSPESAPDVKYQWRP